MKRILQREGILLAHLLRIPLGLIFLVSATEKLLAPMAFAEAIEAYRLIPVEFIALIAAPVIAIELMLGSALVLEYQIRKAALLSAVLLFIFTAAMISVIYRGLSIECGCFTWLGRQAVNWENVARNILLIIWALGISVIYHTKTSPCD